MYSDKTNVNILTALLVKHGVRHAVVCPGSRNAPITHNLHECGAIKCHPVVDERSAAFFALGIIQATGEPVAVCVTSGSALLNTASAVSEAYYQHLPLIVISADRPAAWLDQMDGQTLRQQGCIDNFTKKSVSLPEPHDDETRWYCNRLTNDALLATNHHGRGPVHINVHISEPLYSFNTAELPDERVIRRLPAASCTAESIKSFLAEYRDAERPMIIVGQSNIRIPRELAQNAVVITEALSAADVPCRIDEMLAAGEIGSDMTPDFIVYLGGMIVSKRLKKFLRKCSDIPQWRVDPSGDVADTFCHLTGIIEAEPQEVVNIMAEHTHESTRHRPFVSSWRSALTETDVLLAAQRPEYAAAAVVKHLEEKAAAMEGAFCFHYANSTPIRLANTFARHRVLCNRGVNGIDGSLSTAAGYSAVADETVICVIGDLSFFYDANALWNNCLRGNLRILLINNGTGAIFHKLPGFNANEPSARLIAGSNQATAKGICMSYGVDYIEAHNTEEMTAGIDRLLGEKSDRPILLEILTP